MSTTDIANKAASQPLERKKTPAPVLDNPENSVEEKRVGWFDQNEFRGFDATAGSVDFNPDRKVPQILQSEIFKDGGYAILGAVQTGIDTMGGAAKDTGDALSNLVKIATGKEGAEVPKAFEGEDPAKLDPTVARKQKEAQEFSADEQQKGTLEAKILNIHRELDNLAQLATLKQEVADLTGLQAMLSGKSSLVNEAGEIRTDLQASVAQRRKEILQSQQITKNPISSASKQGGQGANLNQNEAPEGGSQLASLKVQ